MSIEGVDYTTTDRPSIAALKAAGMRFACRYGGPGGSWKQIDLTEVRELTAAGIAIVANAEGTADGLRYGRSAGISWATLADSYFRNLGMPAGRPIYFSVDFDTSSDDWAALDAAFDGIASVIGVARVGVYGEYSLVRHLAGNGKARWFWQTYAWSAGQWYAGNHIEQYRNGVAFGGGTVDLDRALKTDYGQWGIAPSTEEDMRSLFFQVTGGADIWYLSPIGRIHIPDLTTLGALRTATGLTEVVQVPSLAVLDVLAPLPTVPTLSDAQVAAIIDGVVAGLDSASDVDLVGAVKQAFREGTGTITAA